jgi:hypothetical protein
MLFPEEPAFGLVGGSVNLTDDRTCEEPLVLVQNREVGVYWSVKTPRQPLN